MTMMVQILHTSRNVIHVWDHVSNDATETQPYTHVFPPLENLSKTFEPNDQIVRHLERSVGRQQQIIILPCYSSLRQ